MNYGHAIRVLRTARGLSQRELATGLNKDQSYLSLLESGRRASSYATGRTVTVSPKSLPADHLVRQKLLERYRKAGWKIEEHHDQRDHDHWFTFSAAKRT